MDPLLVNEHLDLQEKAIKEVNNFCSKINQTLPEFKKETGYSLDINELQLLLRSNDLTSLIGSIDKSMEKSFASFNEIVKRTLKAGTSEYVYSFGNQLKRFATLPGVDHINSLSITNDQLTLSKDNEHAIRETFKKFITSEAAKEFLEKHKAITDSMNEFSKFVKDKTSIPILHAESFGFYFFKLNNQTGSVSMLSIDYERLVK
ncbi:MAG: hypothetical protein ABIP35_04435 [Ginsengibacter sp.]